MAVIFILYCISCMLQLQSQVDCCNLHAYIDETLRMCHVPQNNDERNKETHQEFQSKDKVFDTLVSKVSLDQQYRRMLAGSNLAYTMKSYLICVDRYWKPCRAVQLVATPRTKSNAFFQYGPCYYGHIHGSHKNIGMLIQVHKSFQINVTFEFFYMEHDQPECPAAHLHYVMVSVMHLYRSHLQYYESLMCYTMSRGKHDLFPT